MERPQAITSLFLLSAEQLKIHSPCAHTHRTAPSAVILALNSDQRYTTETQLWHSNCDTEGQVCRGPSDTYMNRQYSIVHCTVRLNKWNKWYHSFCSLFEGGEHHIEVQALLGGSAGPWSPPCQYSPLSSNETIDLTFNEWHKRAPLQRLERIRTQRRETLYNQRRRMRPTHSVWTC